LSKPLESLFHLQSLDTRLLEKQRVVTRFETELAARRASIAAATAKIEGLTAQRKEAVSARALAERKVEDLTESLKQKRQRSQKARNEKEMHAGQSEVASAQEEIREAESAQLDAMAKVEEYEAAIELAKKARVELENEDHRQVSEAEARIAALREEVAADRAVRDAAAVGIDANLKKKYDFLLGRRAGLAVVEIDSTGCCGGCHVQIPPQTLLEVRRSGAIRVCQMCQRLLYAVAPPPEAAE
jgi:predicted  nucleic acid-binding Zn-ribbon protein